MRTNDPPVARLAILVVLALALLPSAASATTLDECERWIASSPFRSREGLLQMFARAVRREGVRSASFDRNLLAILDRKLETLFPLSRTERVTYADSILEIRFLEPVTVVVPGTWRQARLSMSRTVRFHVRPSPEAPEGLVFEIVQGSARLDFGWLARRISAMPDHLDARRLRYWSDDARGRSGIALEQETRLEPGSFRISRSPGSLRIACPPRPPLAFTDTTAEYFGVRLLRRGDSLLAPDGKWHRDPAAARGIAMLRPLLEAEIDSAHGRPPLYFLESLDYRLEERKGSLGKGFRLRDAP